MTNIFVLIFGDDYISYISVSKITTQRTKRKEEKEYKKKTETETESGV